MNLKYIITICGCLILIIGFFLPTVEFWVVYLGYDHAYEFFWGIVAFNYPLNNYSLLYFNPIVILCFFLGIGITLVSIKKVSPKKTLILLLIGILFFILTYCLHQFDSQIKSIIPWYTIGEDEPGLSFFFVILGAFFLAYLLLLHISDIFRKVYPSQMHSYPKKLAISGTKESVISELRC